MIPSPKMENGMDLGSWAVWRPPPGKRGAVLLGRLVEGGPARVRRLGRDRAGEMRITRFLRNRR